MNSPPYDLITFDVYSALFDLESSLRPRMEPLVGEAAGSLLAEWRRLQLEYTLISTMLGRGHVSFHVVTRRALDVALHRFGIHLEDIAKEELVAAWNDLVPWPEVPEVLRTVKARGHRIAILSNGDVDMLATVTKKLDVTFDAILSAQEAGVYKPHPHIYHLPVHRLGIAPERILHVAGSARDVMGAKAAGLACLWVNRSGDRVLDLALDADMESGSLYALLQ